MAETEKGTSVNVPQRELASTQSLEQNSAQLHKFGGFKLLETVIQGADNLNPDRKAKKAIFLNEKNREKDRKDLKKRLELWKDLLQSKESSSVETLSAEVKNQGEAVKKRYEKNLAEVISEIRELETTYRGVALFFSNAENSGMKIRNVSFLNASLDQLDPNNVYNNDTIEYVKRQIHEVYNQFDLTDAYSIMVIPGYLGSKLSIDTWAKIAHDHKVMLITDYRNMDDIKDLISTFQRDRIASDAGRYANVLMACNYLVGRGKYEELEEDEDLYVHPSTALAGKVHMNLISQVSAGLQFGALEQTDGVRLNLLKTEVGELETLGMVPMAKQFGKVIPFSSKTLYNGSNVGWKTYSVVRVFDWVMKVLMHFLNKRAMENWSGKLEKELTDEIVDFLDRIKGPGKIIERFEPPKFRQDPTQPDRIFIDINITPFFPAKTFIIGLHGEKGRNEETGRRNSFGGDVKQR